MEKERYYNASYGAFMTLIDPDGPSDKKQRAKEGLVNFSNDIPEFREQAIKAYKAKVLRAFEMIGKQMISNIPLPFNLSILYHPSVSSFISEVEFCDLNPENVNAQELNDVLNGISYDYIYFVIPLLLELPAWFEKIQTICPPCYERINRIVTYMFLENSNL